MPSKSENQDPKHQEVDLSESSIYGNEPEATPAFSADDIATQSTIDRLEEITGGDDDTQELADAGLYLGRTGRESDKLDASTEEEIDALKLDLYQTDARPNSRDGSGRIVDGIAEEQLAEFTEVGPELDGEGAESVAPGNDDTSDVIRRHHPNTEIGRADAIVEGNLGETSSDETRSDAKVDEGPGA
jgi:hypothetical protein